MATRLADLPLSALFVSSLNTRRDLAAGQEDSGIEELAASIREQGLLQPITVRPTSADRYEVIVGQRRFLACQKAGHDPISCVIRDDVDDVVHDGFERLAMVYEARGDRPQAVEYYRKALAFMQDNADNYDAEGIDWMRKQAESMEHNP